ncbi:hypothetical protein GUITHDRAFT_119961 [Guillardia theta CCMP2712]|uniref:Uncharacterized protein n=1 Tax=Guillardia theta (strain CCMP2712) TaxID=905079 RepID=L1ICQ5_GUITC|nr:hypothetical protein GUITHDRAFT_119961 [Guillardia theta CCMP2712]EKX33852.1 hypothetical protein GUITHDRAFT_119961 [Guillardia theta CCMP2712]|eukprot:XP_005820832.1 hypothetical protein GUITHDRAFT_119961 [Guillardia theta CCMP2712]
MRAGSEEQERPRRSHESLIATAMRLLGEQARGDQIALLAMLLQEKEMEKEFEIQLVMKDRDMAHAIQINKFKRQLSYVTQRLLLANHKLRIAAWEYVGLPRWLQLPHFDESPELLCGILSEAMHSPNGAYVYISDQAPAVEAKFFKNLARVFRKELETYNQDLAEQGIQEEVVEARRTRSSRCSDPPRNKGHQSKPLSLRRKS